MNKIVTLTLIAVSICLVAGSLGCLRAERGSPVDENQQLARNSVIAWKDALEKRDVALLGKVISKDYKNARGMNREAYLEHIRTSADEPVPELTDLQLAITGDKATASGIAISMGDGQKVRLGAVLVKEPDGVWRIVEHQAENPPGM